MSMLYHTRLLGVSATAMHDIYVTLPAVTLEEYWPGGAHVTAELTDVCPTSLSTCSIRYSVGWFAPH
jgi:hypothetical protein